VNHSEFTPWSFPSPWYRPESVWKL
jgi:hypothetical protein